MNTSALAFSFPRQQNGAVSLVIIALLVFILSAAVVAVLRMSGSSVTDSSTNEAQVSALSLAESGLENAQATLTLAGYTNAACISLAGTTSNLGRGTFSYTAAVFNAGVCTVTITGAIGTSSRTIRAALSNVPAQGAAGNGATIPLRLTTGAPNVAVITNLAYPDGAAAAISTCTNPANCGDVLQVTGAGANGLSNRSVFENVAASGVYAITQTLVAPRNFVQVAAVFNPEAGQSVGHVGAYAQTGNTSGTGGGAVGSIRAGWNCAPNSTTGGANVAAGANTLVYGFSSLAAPANQLNKVTVGGHELGPTPIRSLTGNQGDNLYSQLWTVKNPVYLSSSNITSGADVTGYAGKGSMVAKPSGDKLCISSESPHSGEEFQGGDEVSGSNMNAGTTLMGEPSDSGQVWCECNGGNWDTMMGGSCKNKSMSTYGKGCRLNKSQSSSSNATVMVAAKLLTVTAASKPYLEPGDTIFVGGVPKGKIVAQLSGTTGGIGTYSLDSNQLFSSSRITSNGTIVTSTTAGTIPAGGLPVGNPLIAMNAGTGTLSPGTKIIPTPSGAALQFSNTATKYRISVRPVAPISGSGAQFCGGVCAFLDHDGSPTEVSLNNIAPGTNWSSGFTCLNNVSAANASGEVIDPHRGQWSEVVR